MRINKAFSLFLLLMYSGLLFGQADIDTKYEISVKALDAIRDNNIGAFKALMDENVLKTIKEETFIKYMNSASEIVRKYDEVAQKEFVLIETSESNYQNKIINLVSINFPFPPPNKPVIISDQQLIFIFSDDIQEGKILGFKLRDFTGPARRIEEEARKIPHLEKFNLKIENLSWFRVWYDKGPAKNELGNESGVYALSGDKELLKKAKIYELFSEILTLINNSIIDSTDINYSLTKTIGNPEDIYIRMTFDNKEYIDLGEFTIFTILTNENGIDELSKGYIIFMHSRTHRYIIDIERNIELWNKLKELAHIDHGNLVEIDP